MPPRLNLFSVPRALAVRTKPPVDRWRVLDSATTIAPRFTQRTVALRAYTSDAKKDSAGSQLNNGTESPASDPTADTLPSVSEEASQTCKITGVGGPELEQGTPVQELVKGDKAALEKLPKVIRDALNASSSSTSSKPQNSRSFSTSTRRREAELVAVGGELSSSVIPTGLKFSHVPELPIPSDGHLKYRYDPVVRQVTSLIMQHGKKGVAQRNMARILEHLRTAPAPKLNPQRPLLPGAPPAYHLPLNPVLYLTLAIDSVAPLIRIRSQRGAAGGGVALQIPVPLGLRQRRRAAIEWILTAASKRRNRGSGKGGFAQRVAEELVAVVQGSSGVWERRAGVHRLGMAARVNVNFAQGGRR